MSVGGDQQRTLEVMEDALKTSAPRLTAMFAMFTRLAADEEPVSAEPLPPRRGERWRSLLLILPVAAMIMLIVSLVLDFTAGGAAGCVPVGHAPTAATGCGIPARK
jgi:hypothetical protein